MEGNTAKRKQKSGNGKLKPDNLRKMDGSEYLKQW